MTAILSSQVVTILAAVLRDALPTVTVFDGSTPDQNADYLGRWVSIGDPWDEDEEPVTLTRTETGARAQRRLDYEVACASYAGSGDTDFNTVRELAAQAVADVDAAIHGNRTLSGQVAQARMGEIDRIAQGEDEHGIGVRIGFTIVVTDLP